jgi:hypothetical protein
LSPGFAAGDDGFAAPSRTLISPSLSSTVSPSVNALRLAATSEVLLKSREPSMK